MEKLIHYSLKNYICKHRLRINEIAMKKIRLTFLALTAMAWAYGQQGQLNINQDKEITKLLEIYKTALKDNDYYRVQIGFSTNDAKAQNLKSNAAIDFPNLPARIDFASPTYRVRIGRFKTKLEAERMYNKIRRKYPNAMLLKPKKSTR